MGWGIAGLSSSLLAAAKCPPGGRVGVGECIRGHIESKMMKCVVGVTKRCSKVN